MSERSDNPFKDLGKRLFPARDSCVKEPVAPRPDTRRSKHAARAVHDVSAEDEALFLEAVGNIRRQVPAGSGSTSFAEAFGASGGVSQDSVSAAKPVARKQSLQLRDDRTAELLPEISPASLTAVFPPNSKKIRAENRPAPDSHAGTPAAEGGAGDADLFFKAMQGVRPVAARGREVHVPKISGNTTPPVADPRKLLRDILEGRVEFALHHTEEYMEGFVAGLDPLVLGRLRAGQFSPEAHIDLHGQNSLQAYDLLIGFIKNAWQRNLRSVIVVTGRGRNSPDGISVLRGQLGDWLTKEPFKRVVLAFCTAQPCDGGPGAVYVLLRKYKKSRGKILWERHPSADA